METSNYNAPDVILKMVSDTGAAKAKRLIYKQAILAFMAGAFVAFGAYGSSMAAFNLLSNPDMYGVGRFLAGLVFCVALMMVIIAGGELFTGNMMIVIPVLNKKTRVSAMLLNWTVVFIFNFAGALFIASMASYTGLLNAGGGLLGGLTIKLAYGKLGYSFLQAFALGILCNWLVCIAVWMSIAARDITGKILAVFFVIMLFVITAFEHCIANMFYIPAGIFAKGNELWAERSGLTAEQLGSLTWDSFLVNNLLPVTLGNIIGGAVLVFMAYWVVYKETKK